MRKVFLTLLSFLAISYTQAQTHFGINFQLAVPTGDYAEATQDVGFGGGFNVWVPFSKQVPVFFGIDFGYNLMGTAEQRINENANIVGANGQVLGNIPINYRIRTNNNLLHTHVGLRVKAPLPMVQPYVEGLVGFNYLYTRTKIFDETPNNNPQANTDTQITARNQLSDFVFSYGAGGGMMIKLGRHAGIDVRVVYLLGNDGEYYRDQDIENWTVTLSNPNASGTPQDATVNSNSTVSRTDFFYTTIGMVFAF